MKDRPSLRKSPITGWVVHIPVRQAPQCEYRRRTPGDLGKSSAPDNYFRTTVEYPLDHGFHVPVPSSPMKTSCNKTREGIRVYLLIIDSPEVWCSPGSFLLLRSQWTCDLLEPYRQLYSWPIIFRLLRNFHGNLMEVPCYEIEKDRKLSFNKNKSSSIRGLLDSIKNLFHIFRFFFLAWVANRRLGAENSGLGSLHCLPHDCRDSVFCFPRRLIVSWLLFWKPSAMQWWRESAY